MEVTEDQTYLMEKLNLGAASPLKEEDLIEFNNGYGERAVTEQLRYMAYGGIRRPFTYLKLRLRALHG